MRCLLRQSAQCPGWSPPLDALRKRHTERQPAGVISLDEATDLRRTTDNNVVTYVIIDALDACDRSNRQELIRFIKALSQGRHNLMKIIVSSRENPDIYESLDQSRYPSLCIDATSNQADIVLYVETKVQEAFENNMLFPEAGER